MKKLVSVILCLVIFASSAGIVYGLINEKSRPFVIAFVILCWLPYLWEIKKAPTETKHFSKV